MRSCARGRGAASLFWYRRVSRHGLCHQLHGLHLGNVYVHVAVCNRTGGLARVADAAGVRQWLRTVNGEDRQGVKGVGEHNCLVGVGPQAKDDDLHPVGQGNIHPVALWSTRRVQARSADGLDPSRPVPLTCRARLGMLLT